MKVLFLSCNTGMGHNSCAAALQEAFRAHGVECETVDTLSFISKKISRLVEKGHISIYRYVPGLFRWGYRYSERHPAVFQEKSAVYKLLTQGVGKLADYIKTGGFDTVISTHVFSSLILTVIEKEYEIPLKTAYVSTDYTCSPCTGESDLDYYFIPEKRLVRDFVRGGVREDRIIASGLPASSAFYKHENKQAARKKLGIRPDSRHLLFMCGSMGCGPMRDLVKQIGDALEDDMEMSVICGNNKGLQLDLIRSCHQENVHIVGYTRQMPLYMDSADLYLTKPGGLSVTEAMAKDLPMVFVDAVAGCEEYNMRFCMDLGIAESSKTIQGLADLSIRLLRDETSLDKMRSYFREHPARNAAEYIYQVMAEGPQAADNRQTAGGGQAADDRQTAGGGQAAGRRQIADSGRAADNRQPADQRRKTGEFADGRKE